MPPGASDEPIARLELIDMGPTVMILAVGQHGRVDKRVLDRPEGTDATRLSDAEQRMRVVRGQTYIDAQAMLLKMAAGADPAEHDIILHVADTLRAASQDPRSGHVVVGGVANLADETQAWRRETLRRLFETLEREQELVKVLQDVSSTTGDLSVTIGGEHPRTGEWEASIVASPFMAGHETVGTIGVVGPTRMDYVSAMASVRAVAKRLSELATELDE